MNEERKAELLSQLSNNLGMNKTNIKVNKYDASTQTYYADEALARERVPQLGNAEKEKEQNTCGKEPEKPMEELLSALIDNRKSGALNNGRRYK